MKIKRTFLVQKKSHEFIKRDVKFKWICIVLHTIRRKIFFSVITLPKIMMMLLLLLLWLRFYSSKHGRKEAILGEVIYHEGIASILHDNNCQLLIFIWFCIQSDSMACLIYPEKWISNWVMLDICGLIKRIYCYHQQQHFMSGIVLFSPSRCRLSLLYMMTCH